MLYLSGIDYESIADGDGVRCVIFVSGCRHNCPGCHSPQTHDFENGTPVTPELIRQINDEIMKRPFLSGITLSGGDPMYQAYEVNKFLDELEIPNDNIWIYTGFTLDEIYKDANMLHLLIRCSVLVDGCFDQDKRDVSLRFRGSSNQRIIELTCNNCANKDTDKCPEYKPHERWEKICYQFALKTKEDNCGKEN